MSNRLATKFTLLPTNNPANVAANVGALIRPASVHTTA
jgi:hypothetical protein